MAEYKPTKNIYNFSTSHIKWDVEEASLSGRLWIKATPFFFCTVQNSCRHAQHEMAWSLFVGYSFVRAHVEVVSFSSKLPCFVETLSLAGDVSCSSEAVFGKIRSVSRSSLIEENGRSLGKRMRKGAQPDEPET